MVSRAEEFIARRRKSVAAPGRRGTADVAVDRADRARRLQREGRSRRGRLAPAHSRIPRYRRDPEFHRLEGLGAHQPIRRGDARPHHPHQKLAAGLAGGRPRQNLPTSPAWRATPRVCSPRAITATSRTTTPASAASSTSSIPCPASCWCPASACSASAAPSAMLRSPPTSPRPGSKASATPKRSAASSRSPKPTCSIANIGRSSRPSSAPARSRRSPARSPSSPAPAALSAPQPRRRLPRPAPKWRFST